MDYLEDIKGGTVKKIGIKCKKNHFKDKEMMVKCKMDKIKNEPHSFCDLLGVPLANSDEELRIRVWNVQSVKDGTLDKLREISPHIIIATEVKKKKFPISMSYNRVTLNVKRKKTQEVD